MKVSVSKYTLTSGLLIMAMAVLSWLLGAVVPLSVEFFRFPLNVILFALWGWVIFEFYRTRERNVIARYLLSRQAAILSITLLVVGCIVMGLQRKPATDSYLFSALILFVITQLSMVTLRGWRDSSGIRWIFLFCHLGLLLALISGYWGAPDTMIMRAELTKDGSSVALCEDGKVINLDYQLSLTHFKVDYYDNGVPSAYEATVDIDGRAVKLTVNHPYRVSAGEHIYLTSFEEQSGDVRAVVQIVRQPWRVVMFVGIILMLAGAVLIFIRGPKR
jgi:hypothetical protein